MVNVIDEFASERNFALQDENIEKFSAGIDVEKFARDEKCFNGGMGEKSANIFGGRMVNVVDEFASEMNVELQGENIDKFSSGIDLDGNVGVLCEKVVSDEESTRPLHGNTLNTFGMVGEMGVYITLMELRTLVCLCIPS